MEINILAKSEVDKAMEGLQELLDTLGDHDIDSGPSSPRDIGPKGALSDSMSKFPTNRPDSDRQPNQGGGDVLNDSQSNPGIDAADTVDLERKDDQPKTKSGGTAESNPEHSVGRGVSTSEMRDGPTSRDSDNPKTGNSVSFTLPDDCDRSKDNADTVIFNKGSSKPAPDGHTDSSNHKDAQKVNIQGLDTNSDVLESNWRDSMNDPRPSPCLTPSDKDLTNAPNHKDNVFAGGQKEEPPKAKIGNGYRAGIAIGTPAMPGQPDTTGASNTPDSNSDTESDELTNDDVIQALNLKEERMILIDKLFPKYPEKVPEFSAPDGGYGWVILVVSFLLQSITIALPLSFGVFYNELLSYFGDSNTDTAWVGAIAAGCGLGAGPIASILCNQVGFRLTCIIGGLVSSVGLFVSSFAPNIYMLYGSFGVLTGLGVSISYIPSVVIIGYYFDKRRNLANGIACSGVALGTLVYPLLIESLVVAYSWRGAMIVLSGILLNCCALGALLRPTHYCRIISRVGNPSVMNITLFTDWRFCLFCLSEILWNIGSLVLLTAAPDHANLHGTSQERSALLLSVTGIGGLVGRIVMAFAMNGKNCNRLLCLAFATLVTGIPMALFTFSDLYPVLVTHCLVYGLGFGFQLGLLAVVTLELFTLEKLASAYGYVMLSDGLGAFVGPIATGILYDRYKDYSPAFLFGASVSVLAAVIFFILVIHQYHQQKSDKTGRGKRDIEEHYHTEGFL